MVTTHNLGFPRIGAARELKFAQEKFWRGEMTQSELEHIGADLRQQNWQHQAALDYVPVGDFSFYDQVLDMSFLLGHIPERASKWEGTWLDKYFRVARGRSANDDDAKATKAGEMTKWFDTNYHYIVPEFQADTEFSLHSDLLLAQLKQAQNTNINPKPTLIGPISYLWLGKSKDGSDPLKLLERLLPIYTKLLDELAQNGVDWVQMDEPVLVMELSRPWQEALQQSYAKLAQAKVKLLLTTYFGQLESNLELAANLPVAGLHLDTINAADEITPLINTCVQDKIISLGVINGRNIWKTDLTAVLDWLEPLRDQLGDRLWLAPSCSLLHVPVDLAREQAMDASLKNWLAFAMQKLEELAVLARALNEGRPAVADALSNNAQAITSRKESARVHNPRVQDALKAVHDGLGQRKTNYAQRAKAQRDRLKLPPFPTTTIGSFPQTQDIRKARLMFRKGELDEAAYTEQMKQEIARAVREQEALGLDVLVHGEAERNDMVEYFGEQLDGYVFSQFGWVQSYGSRCVKPPILFGDVHRPRAMTVEWSCYAQSLTDKPMKGMLTGPVTILNWSFVRDDQPRRDTCLQLALAMRQEVLDLEQAGIGIIQIDEAALREGLPLRKSQWQEYLDWAIESFRICANGVRNETQIHTHMCYSEFNDIMEAIAQMDADVITIENSRSDMELLKVFERFQYPNEIGPGVYDIHSPNIPSQEQVITLMRRSAEHIPQERLWVNPDCGLKTRNWDEVIPALKNMVSAAQNLRKKA